MRDLSSLIIQMFQIAQIIPPLRYMTIYHLTMPYDHYERANLVNLYAELATTPRRFYDLTGITREAFHDLYHDFLTCTTSKLALFKQRIHSRTLDANILLLLLIWLRQYPGNSLLSLMFRVSRSKISYNLRFSLPILTKTVRSMII
ncbi:unnamed protein product [Didymodactylos carnosus]|uniref:Transposase Helix-turn-helix domain-containing protein n=1 Tax=Didymodactylos carnosus TaxID=1234261 RepID=A0A815SQP1_9BILA|nr:unnamed protein product [Didymodactylos carnosus]CAF4357635.1 unnamed protein product [Didymodactylos carnosus]